MSITPSTNLDRLRGVPLMLDSTRDPDAPPLLMTLPYTLPHEPVAQLCIIGTRPLPEHWREARLIVRRGLADVLAWLGQPVEAVTLAERLFAKAAPDA